MSLSGLRRAAARVVFNSVRYVLLPVEVISARYFMRIYERLLAAQGVRFDGSPRYISRRVRFDDFDQVRMGERAVISEGVVFLTHDYSLTTGLISLGKRPDSDVAFIRPIQIGRNVFIGLGSVILPGATLGDDTVVGAGSVVRGKFEANSVIFGNPAVRVGSLTEHAEKWASRCRSSKLRVD